jgi:HK97 family phage prohead protease
MNTLHFETPFELKFLAETGLFEGYASVFHVTDNTNDRIEPGAFRKSLAEWAAQGRLPPLLWQHDPKQPIGRWREMHEDSHGLYVRGELFTDDISRAKEAYKLLREAVVTGLSIGYRARQSYRDQKSGVRVLTDIELLEVSMVTFPANEQARVRHVKSVFDAGQIPSEREVEAFLRDAGLSRKQAKGFISGGYKNILPREAENTATEDVAALKTLSDHLWRLSRY